jgi:hypothetical protein
MSVIDRLESLNRKERYFLVGYALEARSSPGRAEPRMHSVTYVKLLTEEGLPSWMARPPTFCPLR